MRYADNEVPVTVAVDQLIASTQDVAIYIKQREPIGYAREHDPDAI